MNAARIPRRAAIGWIAFAGVVFAATLYAAINFARVEAAPESSAATGAAAGSADGYVARLESHLQRQPRDARGWVLLGRAHAEAERFDAAARAFEHAVAASPQKVGKDAGVLCELADALAMMQGGQLRGRPAELVAEALALNPRDPAALDLGGSAAYEDGRYSEATILWTELLDQLRPDSARHQELAAAIDRARQRGDPAPR